MKNSRKEKKKKTLVIPLKRFSVDQSFKRERALRSGLVGNRKKNERKKINKKEEEEELVSVDRARTKISVEIDDPSKRRRIFDAPRCSRNFEENKSPGTPREASGGPIRHRVSTKSAIKISLAPVDRDHASRINLHAFAARPGPNGSFQWRSAASRAMDRSSRSKSRLPQPARVEPRPFNSRLDNCLSRDNGSRDRSASVNSEHVLRAGQFLPPAGLITRGQARSLITSNRLN